MKRRLPDLRENRLAIVLGLALGMILNLAFLFLVNVPRGRGLQSADRRAQELSRELLRRSRSVAELGHTVERIRNREHTLKLFFGEVLAEKERRMVPFQRETRAIAVRHGIDPASVSYSHPLVDGSDDMVRFAASFPLKGSYQTLRAFIRDIEHSENFLIIDGIDIANSREGGVILALNIEVSTLFRDTDLLRESTRKGGRRR